MMVANAKSVDAVSSTVGRNLGLKNGAYGGGVFSIKCFDKDGNLKWEDSADNLVVDVGLQDMNSKYFKGASYSATWYLGLITGPASGTTIAAVDTLVSHAGWVENTNYTGGRKAVTFGTATTADPSVISNSASPCTFYMNGSTTIAGAFLASVASGTSGILFSASDFQAPGDRTVISGDVLNVTYQFSLDAA